MCENDLYTFCIAALNSARRVSNLICIISNSLSICLFPESACDADGFSSLTTSTVTGDEVPFRGDPPFAVGTAASFFSFAQFTLVGRCKHDSAFPKKMCGLIVMASCPSPCLPNLYPLFSPRRMARALARVEGDECSSQCSLTDVLYLKFSAF